MNVECWMAGWRWRRWSWQNDNHVRLWTVEIVTMKQWRVPDMIFAVGDGDDRDEVGVHAGLDGFAVR